MGQFFWFVLFDGRKLRFFSEVAFFFPLHKIIMKKNVKSANSEEAYQRVRDLRMGENGVLIDQPIGLLSRAELLITTSTINMNLW